jgi:alkylation response protein AidB-like acyl-CoA dehydrogenase
MPLVLTDEQTMLRDSVRSFLRENAPVEHLRRLRDSGDSQGFSTDVWRSFVELGFAGILLPEQFGGLGLGFVEVGVVMEEIGRNLSPAPFLSTSVLAATSLVRGGSEAHKAKYLPEIARGGLIAALAVDERTKHGAQHIALRADRRGDGFRLNGSKTFVVDGHIADLLIVAARTAGSAGDVGGLTLFLVDRATSAITTERTVMVDSHNAARLTFENVTVGADAVLGQVDGGFDLLEEVLNAGRAAVASELLGLSEEAFARTVSYLGQRKQFGRRIGEFQALQHRAAHLYSELEITRAAVLKALQALDTYSDAAALFVAVAKARAGATATLAVQEAVQMHGGMGMTDEFDIGLFMKRARVGQELFGDANFHVDRLARLSGY